MTKRKKADPESDRRLLSDWRPPDERWHLFWIIPLWGFNAGDLKSRALEVAETADARLAARAAAQGEVEELERELTPFRALDYDDLELDWYVLWLSQHDPGAAVEASLAAALQQLLPHLHESQRRAVEHGRRRAQAKERVRPLRKEEAEVNAIGSQTRWIEADIDDLSSQAAQLREDRADADRERSQIRHDADGAHRLASLHLRMNGLGEVVGDLEELLRFV